MLLRQSGKCNLWSRQVLEFFMNAIGYINYAYHINEIESKSNKPISNRNNVAFLHHTSTHRHRGTHTNRAGLKIAHHLRCDYRIILCISVCTVHTVYIIFIRKCIWRSRWIYRLLLLFHRFEVLFGVSSLSKSNESCERYAPHVWY